MPNWILLLRGINVGGNHKLPMKELRDTLTEVGCTNVQTYIQSGNVVFTNPIRSEAKLKQSIEDAIEGRFGFRPAALLISPKFLRQAIEDNPYSQAESQPKAVHFFFLANAAGKPDLASLESIATATEQFTLIDRVFYLYTPDGLGRSKLATCIEKRLGVPTTARNYNTVQMLDRMTNAD